MVNFNLLIKHLKMESGIYIIIGNGSKNQFRYISTLKQKLKQILKKLPKNAAFLYFGDGVNKNKPDIGYAFELINKLRPDINIYI